MHSNISYGGLHLVLPPHVRQVDSLALPEPLLSPFPEADEAGEKLNPDVPSAREELELAYPHTLPFCWLAFLALLGNRRRQRRAAFRPSPHFFPLFLTLRSRGPLG